MKMSALTFIKKSLYSSKVELNGENYLFSMSLILDISGILQECYGGGVWCT